MMIPMGGGMDPGVDSNLMDMLQDMLPKRTKRRNVTVAEARRILLQDELDKLVDMDEVVNEALERTEDGSRFDRVSAAARPQRDDFSCGESPHGPDSQTRRGGFLTPQRGEKGIEVHQLAPLNWRTPIDLID